APLDEHSVEGERALAGAADAGEDHQRVARDVDVHALQVVRPRPADGDHPGPAHSTASAGRFAGRDARVPSSMYHMLSGPFANVPAEGNDAIGPRSRRPRTKTSTVQVASISVLPPLFS